MYSPYRLKWRGKTILFRADSIHQESLDTTEDHHLHHPSNRTSHHQKLSIRLLYHEESQAIFVCLSDRQLVQTQTEPFVFQEAVQRTCHQDEFLCGVHYEVLCVL